MWNSLDSLAANWHMQLMRTVGEEKDASAYQTAHANYEYGVMSKGVQQATRTVKELWERSKLYRISDAVLMAEKQV
jgi:hypothetical protein